MKFFSEGAQRTTLSDRNSGKSRTPLVRARKKWRSTERTRSFHARIESLNKAYLLHPYTDVALRSEEQTSELKSLMRISYADFCLKNKNNKTQKITKQITYLN